MREAGEDEDEDVETIISGMEKIARVLAMRMYEYGRYGSGVRAFGQ